MNKLNYEDFQDKDETIDNIEDVFKQTIVDLKSDVQRPPLAISIGLDDREYKGIRYPLKFGSLGNISLIAGQEKSRKTFVKSLIEACTIGGKSNNYTSSLEITGYVQGKYIISIDSEQSPYDVTMSGKRIPFMVGDYYDKYIPLMWREKSTAQRMILLDWLFTESDYKDNLGIVILDGVVDFVHDFNNLSECKIFTEKLMKYSSQTNCHILGILHLNPNTDKMRGHLGTILGQKAEMVMLVENKGEYSECRCKVVRGSKPFKPFSIRIDDNWMPYISNDLNETFL
jgi:hypothetical protein